ncbi:PorV/PorQ family protein [candidate division KSB1 bacterium]|nr:PorV/PorQ family protein [candidate division KSB1 bacterium]
MRYKSFIIFTLVCALLFVSIQAEASTGKRIGTAGASELLIPVGARATALGGANLANVAGVEAIYWNPAGIVGSEQRAEAMFSHTEWLADVDINYFAATFSLGTVGAVGVSINNVGFGDIIETTIENPEGTGSVFSPNYLTVGFSYSRKMTDRIHFGLTGKMISEKIMSVSASGFGFDFGLQYVNPAAGIKLGVALTNFGTEMKFDGSDLETRVQLPGTETGSTISSVAIPAAKFDLPSQLKIGVAYDLVKAEQNLLSLVGSFVNNSYAFDQYTLGAEYSFNQMFFVRGAYTTAYREGLDEVNDSFTSSSQDYIFGPSFGAGFKLPVGGNMSLSLDYAYRTTKFLNDNQWLSLIVGF